MTQWIKSDVASSIPFDSTANHYDAEDCQEAHEEIDFRTVRNEPTGFPNTTDSEISFDDGTLTFSIAPTGSSFQYYINGKVQTVSSTDTATITDTEGLWFIYYNTSYALIASQTVWGWTDATFVAVLSWNATDNEHVFLSDERHGLVMDWRTHQYLHRTRFTQIDQPYDDFALGNYISEGDGSSNTHAQLSIGDGSIHDEDLKHTITNSATPSDPFEQKLSTIAYIPVYYVLGTDSIRKVDATAYPVIWDGVNPIQYNKLTGSTFSLDYAPDGAYMNMYIFATNNIYEPVVAIAGRIASTNVASVLEEDALDVLEPFPFQEFVLLYRVIFKTDSAYTNTPKAALYLFDDLRYLGDVQDRYLWECGYNANANTGRYMERLGLSMDEAPFPVPEDGYIRTVTLRTTATNTGVMGLYFIGDLVNPIITFSFSSQSYGRFDAALAIEQDDQLVFKVYSGTFNKPQITVVNQTNVST